MIDKLIKFIKVFIKKVW